MRSLGFRLLGFHHRGSETQSLEQCKQLISTLRHSRAGGSPVEFAIFDCMPLDSRLRGNDEITDAIENNDLNCSKAENICLTL